MVMSALSLLLPWLGTGDSNGHDIITTEARQNDFNPVDAFAEVAMTATVTGGRNGL
jgi:hypothetical protein